MLCGVGQAVCLCQYAMPGSPLLFSSIVPACDSCFRLQPRDRGADDPKPTVTVALGPHSRRRRTAPRRLDFPFLDCKLAEQSQEVAEFGSADRRFFGLRPFHGPRRAADCKNGRPRYQNRGNKASMWMKTKDWLRNQPPLAPPYLRRGIPGSPPRMRRGGGGATLWPLDRFAHWRETGMRKNEGTKPECV